MIGSRRARAGGGRARALVRRLPALALLAAAACGGPAHETRLSGEALGTGWSITIVTATPPDAAELAELGRRVTETLARVDRGMSTWREDAEVARFNARSDTAPFAFGPETRLVIAAALDLARETRGAFDPTVGPLVRLWGFGHDPARTEPDEAALAAARARVGWERLRWDARSRLVADGAQIELDLSAIAKGYAVDAVVAELERERPRGLLVEIGGEVRAVGPKAGGQPWRVGIEYPDATGARLETVVHLTGAALATSGDYRQLRVVAGERLSHVIDPRSGRPASAAVASASVIAPTCMEADAVATALMVLGPEEALAWVAERPWLDALLLVRPADGVIERRASPGWARWGTRAAAPDP